MTSSKLDGTPSTTSQMPARIVLRKKPRRCAHQVYSTVAPSSRATRSARRFSNPSSRWLEKGRLFGSAQTRSVRTAARCSPPPARGIDAAAIPTSSGSASSAAAPRLWKGEDMERPSLGRRLLQVAHRVHESERGGGVAGIEVAGDDRSRPAANAGEDGHVLLAVRSAIADRLADDPRSGLELPERRAGARVHRLEPVVHRAVEDDVAGGGERTAPHRKLLLDAPHL